MSKILMKGPALCIRVGAASEAAAACAGNVVQSLSFSSIVPLTIWAFTFDWPLLDPAPSLGSNFLLGTGDVLMPPLT